jgi:hypothetical protein
MSLNIKIDLSFEQLTDIVKQFSPAEKLKLNEVLWGDKMEVPETHRKLVSQRIKKAKQNPERLIDWNEGSKMLKA